MTDKEKLDAIRAEIHRLVDVRGYDREMANDLFAFMDSLPNEPVSEDLEEAANDYAHDLVHDDVFETFIAGAQWQKERTIEKACEWLENHNDYQRICDNGKGVRFDMTQCVIDFRKAMEE